MEMQIDPVEGILEVPNPLAFFFGYASVAENPEYYKHLVGRMVEALDELHKVRHPDLM